MPVNLPAAFHWMSVAAALNEPLAAVFQIFNSHNYWNISAILNARTGKEFVAQGAEQK